MVRNKLHANSSSAPLRSGHPMAITLPAASTSSPSVRHSFRADIQGLRAISVLMVLVYHSAPTIIPGGYMGVDVFFVISGFLITSHLTEKLRADGKISLVDFYARRAVRILPAAFAVLVLTVTAAFIWIPPVQHADALVWAAATAAYVPNILAWGVHTDYLAETAPSAFQQYWSLGIEEQFYLLWPVFLLLGWRMCGRSEKTLLMLVCISIVASFTACLVTMDSSQAQAFFSLPTRAWELGVGGAAAFILKARSAWPSKLRSGIMAWIGLMLLALAALTYDTRTPYPGVHTAIPVMATALLLLGGPEPKSPAPLLSIRPLQFIGLMSYSLYLVHWPLLVIPQAAVGYAYPLPLWTTLSLAALAIPMAYLIYRFVENPVRQACLLGRMQSMRILLVAVGTSAMIVVTMSIALPLVQTIRLDAGRAAPSEPLDALPVGTAYVPSNLTPTLREGAEDLPLVMENGCDSLCVDVDISNCRVAKNEKAPVVALFGDSHAAQWHPALAKLAEEGLIRLESNVKGDCPSVDFSAQHEPTFEARCHKWRTDVTKRFKTEQPDIILVANYAGNYLDSEDATSVDNWAQGLARTIDALPEGSQVGVIADVPNMGESPAICLSTHLHDAGSCALPRLKALDAAVASAEKETANFGNATYLSLTNYLCGPNACHPIIGNMLTHRDGDHLTATFSRALAQSFMRELEPLLG
jgi:peptidoglycan/LPS O-acetylase OafA/YrhL